MPTFLDPIMMREIIMDHYKNPIHKGISDINKEKYLTIRMDSDSCIDDITLYIKIENEMVNDAKFDGIACAISTASTDILCSLIINKSIKDALYIIEQYKNMIFEKEFDDSVLDEAIVFINTHNQAARIKCATLGANGIEEILKKEN